MRIKEKEEKLKKMLDNLNAGVGNVLYYDVVSSTMDVAFNLENYELKNFSVVVAEEQSKGRGRNGRKWFGSKDDCLFSIILTEYDECIPYSMVASLGVYEVLKGYLRRAEDIRLKWINDVFILGKKVAGILTEVKNNRTVIGIGVNLNTSSFNDSIVKIATSVFLETGIKLEKMMVLSELITSVIKMINKTEETGIENILKSWEEASSMRGLPVTVENENGVLYGVTKGINYKTGALILQSGNKTFEVYEGTLSFAEID